MICEKCGEDIDSSKPYFSNRDGGDLHIDCERQDARRMLLRRGLVIKSKDSSEIVGDGAEVGPWNR